MLDQMSGGRLDVGFGRGASPIELELFGTNPAEARDIYDESLAIVMQGLRERAVSFKGKHFNFDNVPMEMAPLQKPHPPIWYGVHANDSAARSAKQGLNVISLDGVEATRGFSDAYRASLEGDRPRRPDAEVRARPHARRRRHRRRGAAARRARLSGVARELHPPVQGL